MRWNELGGAVQRKARRDGLVIAAEPSQALEVCQRWYLSLALRCALLNDAVDEFEVI